VATGRHHEIVAHIEACYDRHGDTPQGMDWPNAEDALTRHQVMLEVIRPEDRDRRVSLLDLGCGTSQFYEYLRERDITQIDYAGLDLSQSFVELSRQKFPENTYYCLDLLDEDIELPQFDYIVMNGVFTEKCRLAYEEMLTYFERMVARAFAFADRGIAFNVISKHVDWERDDLFHLSLDTLASFLTARMTRNYVIRNDYGLYEYTTYVYREPAAFSSRGRAER
jgi:SAM-dependent methyltransferase